MTGQARGTRATALARRATRLVVDRGLMSAADVHRYGITGRDLSESNGVALVELGNGRGLAVKDLAGSRDGGQGDPEREVAVYQWAGSTPATLGLLPALVDVDRVENLLVLDGLVAARRIDKSAAGVLDTATATAFGRALGRWHAVAEDPSAQAAGRVGPTRPWILQIAGPDRLPVLDRPGPLRELTTRTIAEDGAILTAANRLWSSAPERPTIVHGDIRFANVLLRAGPAAVLLDWESAGIGDPDWDVASALQEYLSIAEDIPGLKVVAGGPASPAVQAFLDGYAEAGRVPDVQRLAPYVAARLLQRIFQLTTWLPGDQAGPEVERHRRLAREVLA